MRQGDKEEVIYNMINAMLLRIHQSGHLAELSAERFDLVKEGIACYKNIRGDIKRAVPFLPIDIADNEDLWVSAGLQLEDKTYLAVWKRKMEGKNCAGLAKRGVSCSEEMISIPVGSFDNVTCIYPQNEPVDYKLQDGQLIVSTEKPIMARLFRLN